jgi:hypothetical protein
VAPCFSAPVVELLTMPEMMHHPALSRLGPDAIAEAFDADDGRAARLTRRPASGSIGGAEDPAMNAALRFGCAGRGRTRARPTSARGARESPASSREPRASNCCTKSSHSVNSRPVDCGIFAGMTQDTEALRLIPTTPSDRLPWNERHQRHQAGANEDRVNPTKGVQVAEL